MSEEEIKEQRYVFDKELLNLFKQPMLISDVEWNFQITQINFFFCYLWSYLYHIVYCFSFSGILGLLFE